MSVRTAEHPASPLLPVLMSDCFQISWVRRAVRTVEHDLNLTLSPAWHIPLTQLEFDQFIFSRNTAIDITSLSRSKETPHYLAHHLVEELDDGAIVGT